MCALPPLVLRRAIWIAVMSVVAGSATIEQVSASLIWDWNYARDGVLASGTFTTDDIPSGSGFYLISGITGTRNGETITGLQPTGTPIPGNEPFAVDNLVSPNGPQLTHNGFGFATSGGNYANPFFADFSSPAQYLEFFSVPPFTAGLGVEDSELPIDFAATLRNVSEPATYSLLLVGLGAGVGFVSLLSRKRCSHLNRSPASAAHPRSTRPRRRQRSIRRQSTTLPPARRRSASATTNCPGLHAR